MQKYLLDTHIVLWAAANPTKLSSEVVEILVSDAVKCVSIASAWEVAVKLSKGNSILDIPKGLDGFFEIIDASKYVVLPVKRAYLSNLTKLPKIHKDPFDRLIMSTALTETLTLITVDEDIKKYDIPYVC